jgi:predicted RNA-binding Zn-ribbon protein involved in translation (DUF1610 family)
LLKIRKELLGKNENRLQIRYFDKLGFHPKLLIFKGKNQIAVILGSSNLTSGGLSRNIEANVLLASGIPEYGPIKDIVEYFDSIWKRKGNYGPGDLTEEILKAYAHNKKAHERLRGAQIRSKKPIPITKFPIIKAAARQSTKATFYFFIDNSKVYGRKLEAFCTKCDRPVTISKKWVTFWTCDRHRGKKAECPSPEEKGEKAGLIRLYIDNAEINAKLVEKTCAKKECKEHVDLTNDFYWLVCPRCYDKINSDERCRIPNSENGFHYRLSCKEIWKS